MSSMYKYVLKYERKKPPFAKCSRGIGQSFLGQHVAMTSRHSAMVL